MSLADNLTAPFFGRTAGGIVYHRFANRKLSQPVTSQDKAGQIQRQLLLMFGILAMMTMSGLAFAAGVTLIIALSPPDVGFDLRWLYLGDLLQLGLMIVVFLVFDAAIQRTIKA